jgi:hypothetical protein
LRVNCLTLMLVVWPACCMPLPSWAAATPTYEHR